MAAVNKVSTPRGSRVSVEGVSDEALPNHINSFFTRFETHDFSSHIFHVKQSLIPDDSAVIDQERVLGLFMHIGVNKCPGPDGICGRTLRCAKQFSGFFQRLFQTSIDTCTFPDIWKLSTVIPIPKKDNPKLPNDSRPITFTSFVMKTLEKNH